MDLFDFARAARDAGMQQALDHAERKEPSWGDLAYDYLVSYARKHKQFTAEDVTDSTKDTDFPQPPTDRAWGITFRKAQRQGVIKQIGTGRRRRGHLAMCPVWGSTTA